MFKLFKIFLHRVSLYVIDMIPQIVPQHIESKEGFITKHLRARRTNRTGVSWQGEKLSILFYVYRISNRFQLRGALAQTFPT